MEKSLDGPLPKLCAMWFLRRRLKVKCSRTFDEKREITPKWVIGFTSKHKLKKSYF
jgi:hypothetical protein